MGKLWLNEDDVGSPHCADAHYRDGCVWLDEDDIGSPHCADAYYQDGCIWLDEGDVGSPHCAHAYYQEGCIWLDEDDVGSPHCAGAYYQDGCIWLDEDDIGSPHCADAYYIGADSGAAAAAFRVLLLLRQFVANARAEDTDTTGPTTAIHEPPEVTAAKRFASATTRSELDACRQQFSPSNEAINQLYGHHADRLENLRIEQLLTEIYNTSTDQLQEERLKRAYLAGLHGQRQDTSIDQHHEELFDLAIKRDVVSEITDATQLHSLSRGGVGPWAVLAKKRLQELDAARRRDDMVRLEALRRSSQQAIYDYITTNQWDTVSYDAVKYLIDKELLVDIAARYCGSPFWAEAKRQYWEVLDAEHRRRNIFQKLMYILRFERMREHSRVGSRPDPS